MGMNQIRLLLPDDPAQFGYAHGFHGQIGNILLGKHLPDDITVRAGVNHVDLSPERLNDLADHLFRAGIDAGIEHMQDLHGFPSFFDSSSAASRILRLRIP